MRQLLAHRHQRKSQQIFTTPAFRVACIRMVCRQPDPPDRIERARFHQYLIAGAVQICRQGRILAKLARSLLRYNAASLLCRNSIMPILFMLLTVILAIIALVSWLRLRAARRADYIRHFTLPQGLYQKLQEKHPALSLRECQLVGMGLRQFFMAYLKSGKQYISMPSQVADDLWHEFILYTRNYQEFCNKAFGNFLHHTPAVLVSSGQQSSAGLRRCWAQVCREELINPLKPARLPLLFALDAKLAIANGFHYAPDCSGAQFNKDPNHGVVIHCGGDLSWSSSDSGDSGSGGDSGSDDKSGGSSSDSSSDGGGCGGGGCGGGGD